MDKNWAGALYKVAQLSGSTSDLPPINFYQGRSLGSFWCVVGFAVAFLPRRVPSSSSSSWPPFPLLCRSPSPRLPLPSLPPPSSSSFVCVFRLSVPRAPSDGEASSQLPTVCPLSREVYLGSSPCTGVVVFKLLYRSYENGRLLCTLRMECMYAAGANRRARSRLSPA